MSSASQTRQLADLLQPYLDRDETLLVQTTQMGDTEAYIGSVKLAWLAHRVGFASQLPLFRSKLDPKTGNIQPDEETIEELYQRPLDWSRQAPLTRYLAARTDRKFPPLLLVVSPAWVDDPRSSAWDKDGRAKYSSIEFVPLDGDRRVGLIDLSLNVSIFALDGQHRLMGIQGLMELLETGTLQPLTKAKKSIGKALTLEDMAREVNKTPTQMRELAEETIGVELIPAVVRGETREEAWRRVRSIFVHVNLMAVKLSKGQVALLNEDDGFAIVTRQIAVTHPMLRQEDGWLPRVNWDGASVSAKSTALTTLQALRDMAVGYLGDRFPHWKSAKPGVVPQRPTAEELADGLAELMRLWDGLATLPSYRKLDILETPNLRRFSFELGGGEGNLLFRPVGQVALAEALGILVFRKQKPLTVLLEKLRQFDDVEGFSGIENPESIWYGVLYDPNKRRIRVAGRELAAKLLVYLLGGMTEPMELAELRMAVAKARTFENRAVSFQGRFVKPREVGLPNPIT
ncbi:MAG: DGQHR domain-containing protein [Cyanobacteria bacterium SBC]|nr:DGQHR domain-containing protein [Cyanobacteria bacterium SBC]